MKRFDVIVIGGGAAGLFCAIEAGKRNRRTVVLEHNESVGKKIRISGGGRCNFTNVHAAPQNYISANPHFCKSALARYAPTDFIKLVERHRIRYHEKKLGQLFCDGSAQQIIDMLVEECRAARVEIRCRCRATKVERSDEFIVETNQETFVAPSLVIATGGLSIPPLGAGDFAYRLARQFDLKIIPTRPGLVPLKVDSAEWSRLKELSGVSIEAVARSGDAEFRENVLLTHRGLSGPAILQVSSYWRACEEIILDLLPGVDAREFLSARRRSEIELANLLAQILPRRFAHAWCDVFAPSRPMKRYTDAELERTAARLNAWSVTPSGTEGYAKAEVTVGGVDTTQLSSKTMEAKTAPGLFFIGEAVDVTGHLGGYNFQWAWSSGFAAGQFV